MDIIELRRIGRWVYLMMFINTLVALMTGWWGCLLVAAIIPITAIWLATRTFGRIRK